MKEDLHICILTEKRPTLCILTRYERHMKDWEVDYLALTSFSKLLSIVLKNATAKI